MAEHTGQSSQLFSVATGRNAQFLATVARSALVEQVDWTVGSRITIPAKSLIYMPSTLTAEDPLH